MLKLILRTDYPRTMEGILSKHILLTYIKNSLISLFISSDISDEDFI